MNRDRVPGL